MSAKDGKEMVRVLPGIIKPPTMGEVTRLDQAVGQQPIAWNLKDHEKEMDGTEFVLVKVQQKTGPFGDDEQTGVFVVLDGFLVTPGQELKPEDRRIIITGSGNVVERSLAAFQSGALPVQGKFRKSGRAWFFD